MKFQTKTNKKDQETVFKIKIVQVLLCNNYKESKRQSLLYTGVHAFTHGVILKSS